MYIDKTLSPFYPLFVHRSMYMYPSLIKPGADPEIFERGGPEAIIHKILERGGPNSLKMAFECSFQSFSYKSFANIPPKGGARPPLNPPLQAVD